MLPAPRPTSANPLAVANIANFAPGSASGLAGEGNVEIDGHTALLQLNGTGAEIVAPDHDTHRPPESIDIAASGDFELLDQIAPGVIYTAGAPVQPASGGDATTIALGQGAQVVNNGSGANNPAEGTGISTILTPEVNPANAGNITLTVGSDIIGIENVLDTLATGFPGGLFNASPPSGADQQSRRLYRPILASLAADQPRQSKHAMVCQFRKFRSGAS